MRLDEYKPHIPAEVASSPQKTVTPREPPPAVVRARDHANAAFHAVRSYANEKAIVADRPAEEVKYFTYSVNERAAYGEMQGDRAIIAFRGTLVDRKANWLVDINCKFRGKPSRHRGFYMKAFAETVAALGHPLLVRSIGPIEGPQALIARWKHGDARVETNAPDALRVCLSLRGGHTHSLDAGTASGYFALPAGRMGWHVHGMSGFDLDRAVVELDVPAGHRVEAAYAVGKKGDKSSLPEELHSIEQPNTRRPLSELAFERGFPPAMPAGRREVLREALPEDS